MIEVEENIMIWRRFYSNYKLFLIVYRIYNLMKCLRLVLFDESKV